MPAIGLITAGCIIENKNEKIKAPVKRNSYTRRDALHAISALCISAIAGACSFKRQPGAGDLTVLIVSGWQDVNIGDIAPPGLLNILRTCLPDARIIFWK